MNIEKKKIAIGYLCAIGAVVFWGFDTVVIRWLIQQKIDPFLVGDLRLFIGSAVLALIVAVEGIIGNHSWERVRYSKFFWLITLSLAVNFLLFHKGLEFTIASDAVLLEAFSPVMVLIIVMLFLPSKIKHLLIHPGMPQTVLKIVIIGSIGSSLLLINDPKDLLIQSNIKLIGDIIEFIAMFAWALVMIGMHEYQKREQNKNSIAVTAQFLFFAAIIITPFINWSNLNIITSTQWFWILILGVFSTGAAYVLWHTASKFLDILPLITLFNFVSIFTITIESIALNMPISWKLLIGGALILYASMRAKLINDKYKILTKEEPPGE
ncbi:DMT family transporter [Candidatus Peregrinibacteria bacterium]|nr:DMT family transporter [Candidatus Peregrinibacteria bacterium]